MITFLLVFVVKKKLITKLCLRVEICFAFFNNVNEIWLIMVYYIMLHVL